MLSNETLERRYGPMPPRRRIEAMIDDCVDTAVILTEIDRAFVEREKHYRRVTELLEANNWEQERQRRIGRAARDLRAAQRGYLAAKANPLTFNEREECGRKVAEAAQVLDDVLAGAPR